MTPVTVKEQCLHFHNNIKVIVQVQAVVPSFARTTHIYYLTQQTWPHHKLGILTQLYSQHKDPENFSSTRLFAYAMSFKPINLISIRWVFPFSFKETRRAWTLRSLVKSVNAQCNSQCWNERCWTRTNITLWHTEVNKRTSLQPIYFLTKKNLLYDTPGGKIVQYSY